MNTPVLPQTIFEQIKELPEKQQYQVLSFIKSLKTAPLEGVPGKNLLKYAGAIPRDDVEIMRAAIEADCEQIDPNEW